MNNLQKTLFLLLLFFICSCTSDEQFQETSNWVNEGTMKVSAILPDWDLEDVNSRTSITTGTYPTLPSPVWVTGDSIGIYPNAGGDQLSFRINKGGSKTCTFDGGGWAMKSSSYTAYSPFKRSYYYEKKDALPISMLNQAQNGNDNADHFGTYDIQIAKGEKPVAGALVFEFSRKVALARLEITAPKAATWTSVSLESDALFTTEAKMNLDLETPTVTPVATSNSVTLNLKNVSTTNDNLSIIAYMMILPVDLTGKTLSVKLTDSEGNAYSKNANITNNKTNFTANAARWISVNLKEEITGDGTFKDGVVSLAEAGTMRELLGDLYLIIKSLKVVGPINGDDVRCLRQMLGGSEFSDTEKGDLEMLDLSEAAIVEGGEWYYNDYYEKYYTSNDVIGNNMFYRCGNLQNIVLPNNITTVGIGAFSECSSLTSINIPKDVTSIGSVAFESCSSLTSINIPNGVNSISAHTFSGCHSLASVTIGKNVTLIDDYAFNGCSSLTINIPNGVNSIGNYAFQDCSSLTFIDIPNSVTSIGKYAFSGCSTLASVNLSSGITSISEGTFANCSSLISIDIPDGVTSLGNYAFHGCSSLTSINFPKDVSLIGEKAFGECI